MGKLTLPNHTPRPALPQITTLIVPREPEPRAPMPAQSATDTLLLRQFRLFVAEVMRVLDSFATEHDASEDSLEAAQQAAADASDTLAREIDVQTMEISRIGSPADRAAVDELRYLKAAIADELLLAYDWPGRSRHTEYLIETRLFGSSVAGDEIFNRIDALLADAAGQPSQMAALYLFAISVGFLGRHRGPQAEAELQPLRDALFRKIYRREPALAAGLASQPQHAERVLSEQAYRYRLSEIAPVRFFRFSRGTLAFIATMLVLLALSQISWRVTSSPVRKALEPTAPAKPRQPVPSEADRG
jgi:type VI secretion system protein ImpK